MRQSVRATKPWLDPAADPHIRIEKLVKRYDDQVAVGGVSLNIYRGELFALLGGSGCGKTTLLRMLAGFVTPDEGGVWIEGKDVLKQPPYERPVNMMFQSYALFPHMTVEDNVAFGLKRDGVPKDEIRRRVGEVLELVQMAALARRKPAQLSGGQRQRAALARSIVKRPKVLLLDEPLSALDRKLREATQFELVNIQEELGITFVMVTHDQEEAMTMATRIAVMNRGEIVQVGSPADVYDQPHNRFVADFIGSVNLFEGTVTQSHADHVVVASPDLGSDVVLAATSPLAIGEAVNIALRPEKITIVAGGAAIDTANKVPGRIKDMAYLGDTRVYQVVLANGKLIKIHAPSFGTRDRGHLSHGDEVVVGWSASAGILVQP